MPQVGPTTKHWHMMEHAPGHLIIIVKVAMMFMFDLMTMTLRQAWTWSSCRRDLRRRVLEHLSLTFSCWNISVQQPNPGTGEWVQPFFVLLALATRKPDLQGEIKICFRVLQHLSPTIERPGTLKWVEQYRSTSANSFTSSRCHFWHLNSGTNFKEGGKHGSKQSAHT